jgi:hypothetical protein
VERVDGLRKSGRKAKRKRRGKKNRKAKRYLLRCYRK